MPYVFLSYSRQDSEVMRRVRETLVDEGVEVWTDENLTPGTPSWQSAIQQAIEQSAGVVVLLSPDAKRSEWVANELGYAGTQAIRIFPVLIRGEEKDAVPINLINYQRIDLRARFLGQMQMLIDLLKEHFEQLHKKDVKASGMDDIHWMKTDTWRFEFWKQLLERSKGRTLLFNHVQPKTDYILTTSIGRSGISIGYVISGVNDWVSVDFYIDMGDKAKNKQFFDALVAEKDTIETEFGEALIWERLDFKRASRIRKQLEHAGISNKAKWPEIQGWMITTMIRMDTVFRRRLVKDT